jgi:hypothetical protein
MRYAVLRRFESDEQRDTHDDRVQLHAERIVLTERDTGRVLDLLENPPDPTNALLAAARRRSGAAYRIEAAKRAPRA